MDNYSNDDRHERRGLKRASAGALMLAVAGFAGLALVSTAGGPSPLVPAQTPTTLAPSTPPSHFIGIAPVRVLDTRGTDGGPIGVLVPGTLGQGETLNVAIGGRFGVPVNAEAVSVNITIDDDATRKSFLQVFPTGASAAYASSSANNAEPGLVVANSGIIALGTAGQITVLNQQGEVNVIIDVTGYFLAEGTQPVQPVSIAPGATVADADVTAAVGAAAKLAVVTQKYVANPQTAWTAAQFATIGGFQARWNGTAWVAFQALTSVAPGQTIADADVLAAVGATAKLAVVTQKYVANPQTAWTAAQFATIGGFQARWNGTIWVAFA